MPIGALIEKTKRKSEPVTLTVAGETLRFTAPPSYSEMLRTNAEVEERFKQYRKLQKKKALQGDWPRVLEALSDDALRHALYLSERSDEPKIEDLEACVLAVDCGGAFTTLFTNLITASAQTAMEGTAQEIEEAGEDSGGTPSGEAS